jgi:hypothetical protein
MKGRTPAVKSTDGKDKRVVSGVFISRCEAVRFLVVVEDHGVYMEFSGVPDSNVPVVNIGVNGWKRTSKLQRS